MANQGFSRRMNNYKERFQKNRRLRRISAVIAICLACVATVALVIPAVTLEYAKPACGIEEHTHTDACFSQELVCSLPATGAHVHSPECYDPDTLELVCEEEATGHLHVPACLDFNGMVVCGQEETVHVHGPECYELVQPEAESVEGEAVSEDDPAILSEAKDLDLPAAEYVLTCTKESAGHVHSSICLDANGNRICGLEEEVTADHEHDDSCYEMVATCGHEEHVHTDLCFDEISSEVLKDKERKDLEGEDADAADEVQADAAISADELAELTADGLVYENDSMILALEAPEDLEGELKVRITEGNAEPTTATTNSEAGEGDTGTAPAVASTDDTAAADDAAADPVILSEAKNLDPQSTQEDAPAWTTTLNIEAALDGEPVEDIASLGLTAKLQLKPTLVQPILDGINYEEVAEEAKESMGAELVIVQEENESADTPLSERTTPELQETVITDPNNSTVTFDLESDQLTATTSQTANPKFTVEYYSPIAVPQLTTGGQLNVINTSGGVLPTNSLDQNLSTLTLDANGRPVTTTEERMIYSDGEYEYIAAPTLAHFNKLYENGNYKLSEIRVTDSSGDEQTYTTTSTPSISNLHFTNRNVTAEGNESYVLIENGTKIRLVYSPKGATFEPATTFYDYDITDGNIYSSYPMTEAKSTSSQNNTDVWYGKTNTNPGAPYSGKAQGINSPSNYVGAGAKLAFGNANAKTGLDTQAVDGNLLNKNNGSVYAGCTFGLVTGMKDGEIQYASNVSAPKLFGGDDSTVGKTSFDGKLTFNQTGDTYTLTSASVGNGSVTGLDAFGHPGIYDGVQHTKTIWTNDFWPMDNVSSYGSDGHDLKFGSTEYADKRMLDDKSWNKFPTSDDGEDHNSYFGMHYQVTFDLDKDYRGPLEYLFFGDDDLWIFLDGKLVIDIGGVHSSVGEYANLWDHIAQGSEGKHTLDIFYTERGASGSTCYMNFTLPSVSSSTIQQNTGTLNFEKKVAETDGTEVATEDEFEFSIKLTDASGNHLVDDYSYTKFGADGQVIGRDIIVWDGATFRLKGGESIEILYLPIGTKYTIEEKGVHSALDDGNVSKELTGLSQGGYTNKYAYLENKKDVAFTPADDPAKFSGSINATRDEIEYKVICQNIPLVKLPETGGIGAEWFWFGGGLIMTFAVVAYTRGKRRRRKEV